jgi:putative ABC transport system permease protein
VRLLETLFRIATRTLPPALRRKHGPSMEALFRQEVERTTGRGRLRRWTVGWAGVLDAVRRGLYERAQIRRRGRNEAAGWEAGMDGLRQDVGYAVRSLARAPRFTAVAVLTLALGIGASSAVFSVLDAVVLRPLPFPRADRFVHLAWDHGSGPISALTPIQLQYWTDNTPTFEAVATYRSFLARVDEERPVGVSGLRVSKGFLTVLGWEPALGRDFTDEEDVPEGPAVALVSDAFWRDRFGGSPDAVGEALRIGGRRYTVIGVLPAGFAFPQVSSPPQVLVPLGLRVDPADEGENWEGIARLRDGVGMDAARADVARLVAPFAAAYPNQVYGDGAGMSITDFHTLHAEDLSTALAVAMGAAALVLLIACANVANLLLARAQQRRREIALHAALGATRARIARGVVLEGMVLAGVAGCLGVLLARRGISMLIALTPVRLPRMDEIGLDWRVIGFAFAAAFLTGVVFGSAAAVPALRARLGGPMGDGGRGASGSTRGRRGLLVAQAALSMVLLVVSGLLVASLVGLRRVDKGFDPEGVIAVRLPLRADGYDDAEALSELVRRFGEQVRGAVPGARVAAAANLPLERGLNIPVTIGGRPDDFEGAVQWRAISPEYFETLGIDLLEGRPFEETDVAGGPPVAIVNQAFARRYFQDASPIGQRVEVGRYRGEWLSPAFEGPGAEIVGVVVDVREVSLRSEASRTVFVPLTQAPYALTTALSSMPLFLIEAPSRGTVTRAQVWDWLRDVDAGLPSPEVIPLADVVTASLAEERFGASLLSTFAGIALTLTAFGIYGVLAYTVRQRRREIGIRIALGAGVASVLRLVGWQGMAPVAVGLVLGAGASLGLSRPVADMLWGVEPTDPLTIGSVAVLLMVVALAASLVPAREALSVDPVRSLTEE